MCYERDSQFLRQVVPPLTANVCYASAFFLCYNSMLIIRTMFIWSKALPSFSNFCYPYCLRFRLRDFQNSFSLEPYSENHSQQGRVTTRANGLYCVALLVGLTAASPAYTAFHHNSIMMPLPLRTKSRYKSDRRIDIHYHYYHTRLVTSTNQLNTHVRSMVSTQF